MVRSFVPYLCGHIVELETIEGDGRAQPSNELVEMIDEGYFDEPTSRRSPASSAS